MKPFILCCAAMLMRIEALPTDTTDQQIEQQKLLTKFQVLQVRFSRVNVKAMGMSTDGIQGQAHADLNEIEKKLEELEAKYKK